ncbi:hypothetical protein UREG_01753 [Uncinocarpus reesii 1704]|uniref:alpha-amylase n=1 Tax=Uncinocarpus reesii (strain UAMH 1704) TaxID=336963 RepID=C4JJE6_UNCRE|nr:uncharacterized protein UREG_01753 [Uncinocarpus reesii 1704]EEP76904.1 hypothetical protein UREG_01753 [Uncinocarpus reesii 1704]
MLLRAALLYLLGGDFVFAGNADDWKPRSVYQILTDRFARTDGSTTAPCNAEDGITCGGTWKGITDHLDYIQGMGFDAIMISPITKNVNGTVRYGDAYHGYWPQNLYELNHNFGTRRDLLDLSKAVHDRGMYLMVDVVINNMAYITNGSNPAKDVDYSTFVPFNDQKYFHPYCKITNYDDYEMAQKCWTGDKLVPLPDLNTEDAKVTQMMAAWVRGLISNYSVDGLRIDAAKHVDTDYLRNVVKASGVFAIGEVYEKNPKIICEYQNYLPSLLNYPVYYAMIEAFSKGNMSVLVEAVEKVTVVCKDTFVLAAFSENHDLPRFPSFKKELSLAKNVIAFTILSDGIPMYYQGQEQHFSGDGVPENREALWLSKYNTRSPLYNFTASVNQIRRQAIRVDRDYLEHPLYPLSNENGISAFRKGHDGRHIIVVYSRHGEDGASRSIKIPRCGHQHLEFTEITTCRNHTLDDWGALRVTVYNGLPKIFFPANQMGGSGLCGFGDWPISGSKKKGEGKSNIDKTHWTNEIPVNPKWGRRPGREGSRPVHRAKAKNSKKKKRPKISGSGKTWSGWPMPVLVSSLVTLHFEL